ncbi:MAG: DNA2/NAM7 family helicase, partial [Clostridia bacterium]|nr:DNA2/NAM7 family helicase [Clostridia bacterium]
AYEIETARMRILSNTDLSSAFTGFGGINDKKREEFLRPFYELHSLCSQVFMDYNADSFNSKCVASAGGVLKPLYSGLISAATSFIKCCDHFVKTIKGDKTAYADEDLFECYTAKCTSLIDNIDMLPAWSMYKATAKKLSAGGLSFMTDAMESGKISGKQMLSSFRKNVYRNFIQTNIPADESLAAFSANVMDETAAGYSRLLDEFNALTREKIRRDLIARLPSQETEGPLALEVMAFQRQTRGNLRGLNLRNLLADIPELMKVVAPCMLMSPGSVSQYLAPDPDLFDIVIFDEASQIPTCEAVPSLARAKSAIIVGDPKQLPPTSFFMGAGQDDEHPEAEDLESVLEDCLALGIPEKHLIWHYRSKHESLIAFSNITYYSSRLCTFPSPDALDSKVKLRYIENGVYERGLSKCNKEEAEALVSEVVKRLKDPKLRQSSIGVVTFSTPQQAFVEKLLNKAIVKYGLEEAAYEREEPLFVKNLENVQGDERDVILFSVCYGPDKVGKITLNFGPLNQLGGWRRLNVAVSRAREEMVVF